MADEPHRIGRLVVEVALGDLGAAMSLRGRLEDLSWRLMPPVLERALDRLAPGPEVVEIGRLTVDLGTVSVDRLEEDVLAALEPALIRAVSNALAGIGQAGAAPPRRLSAEAARIERFEAFLIRGIVPSHRHGDPFDPRALLRQAIAGSPAALLAMLRRHAGRRTVLERLVLQLGEAGLADLLALLAPADAAAILAFLDDLSLLRRLEPPLPVADPALRRLLWRVTLDYLLNDAGSQFNRRDYVAFLLSRSGEAVGIAYVQLLDRIGRALSAVERKRPLGGSLLGVLYDLCSGVQDREGAEAAVAEPDIDGDPAPGADDAGVLLRQVTAARDDRTRLAAVLHPVTEPLFRRLVALMSLSDAPLILDYLADLMLIHREEALLRLSPSAFERLLRLIAVLILLRDGGSIFNRRSWLRRLIGDLAEEEAIPYAALLGVLARAVPRLRRHLPPASSLPALVAELAAELTASPEGAGAPSPPPDDMSRSDPLDVALVDGDLSLLLDLLEGPQETEVLARLPERPALLARLLARMDGRRRRRLLAGGHSADWLDADLVLLDRLGEGAPGGQAVVGLIWAIALATLRPQRPGRTGRTWGGPDQRAFWRTMLHELARRVGPDIVLSIRDAEGMPDWTAAEADDALRAAGLSGPALGTADPWPVLQSFLTTGQPPSGGARLLAQLRRDSTGLGRRIRRLALDHPAVRDAMIERLLAWLAPDELLAALAPDQAVAALRWLSLLADRPGGDADEAARQVLVAVLAHDPAEIPELPVAAVGESFDRGALLRHWLDHGNQAWWAPVEPGLDTLLEGLLRDSVASVRSLFLSADRERLLARLARAFDRLGAERGEALLARLAPLIAAPGGELATLLASEGGKGPDRRRAVLLRAAAAAVAGAPLDWAGLARPVAVQPVTSDDPPRKRAVADTAADGALLSWLTGEADADTPDGAALRRLAAMLDASGPDLRESLRLALTEPLARARWAELPEEILARLVALLDQSRGRLLHRLTLLLVTAWKEATPPAGRPGDPALPWRLMLEQLADPRHRPLRAMAQAIADGLATEDPGHLLDRAAGLAARNGEAVLSGTLRPVPRKRGTMTDPEAKRDLSGSSDDIPNPEEGEAIHVGNAGLVLFAPFLQTYFERLDVLVTGPDGRRRVTGIEAATRAVHMLQYLVDERCDRPEPDLVLNKLLCGFAPAVPVAAAFEPAAENRAMADSLIAAMLQHWSAISNSSPAGLRETFLQREGRLVFAEDRWTLKIQRKTVDVLVDRIPWGYSLIAHPWMSWPLYVTW